MSRPVLLWRPRAGGGGGHRRGQREVSSPTRPLPPHGSRPPPPQEILPSLPPLPPLGIANAQSAKCPWSLPPREREAGDRPLPRGQGMAWRDLQARQGTQRPPNCGLEDDAATFHTCAGYQAPRSLRRTFGEGAPQALAPFLRFRPGASRASPHHPAGSES